MSDERITVTLPREVVTQIDRRGRSRSRFIRQAVWNELERLRREELRRSVESPHPESGDLADLGLEQWFAGLTDEEGLINPAGGTSLTWSPEVGWSGGDE